MAGGEKFGIYRLDLSEGFAGGEAVDKCCIRSGRVLKEAGRLIRRKVVSTRCVYELRSGGLPEKRIEEAARQGVIEDADTAPDARYYVKRQRAARQS